VKRHPVDAVDDSSDSIPYGGRHNVAMTSGSAKQIEHRREQPMVVMVAMVAMISTVVSQREITTFKVQILCRLRPMVRSSDSKPIATKD
jgi:hypothetical protein